MSTQEILDRMSARKAKIGKVAALYSSTSSKVHKLANIKRGNTAEAYDAEGLDETFASTVTEGVRRAKSSAARLVADNTAC